LSIIVPTSDDVDCAPEQHFVGHEQYNDVDNLLYILDFKDHAAFNLNAAVAFSRSIPALS